MSRTTLRTRRHELLVLISGITLALGASVAGLTTSAEVPPGIQVYGSAAFAGGVHEIAGSNSFSSFGTGAVDNRYPLASTGQDSAPSARARSSVADYGPLVQTVVAGDPCTSVPPPCPFPAHQPPPATYATAYYPGPASGMHGSNSQGPGSTATADVAELSGDAGAVYAGDPSSTFQNATAETHTVVKSNNTMTVFTHSHVGSATFGGGALQVTNTDVFTRITFTTTGQPKVEYTIAPGTVVANGTPTQVSDKGVTINGTSPAPVGVGQALSYPLFKIYTVAPEITHEGNQASITATGLHIGVYQPGTTGVPSQTVEYILGEGHAEGFLTPADAVASTDSGSGGTPQGSADTTGTSDPVGTVITQTTTITNVVAPTDTATTPGGASTTQRPKASPARLRVATVAQVYRAPLALMFFLWEALILGAASAVVWARRRREGIGA
ncbi:MAG: hypothetical protein ACYDGR_03720 [Candidatus Dormibacteria bacterium]